MRSYTRFFSVVVLTNLLSGAVLFLPTAVSYVGTLHLIQLLKGGQPVIDDGPEVVLICAVIWTVGVVITIAINNAIARSSDYYSIVSNLAARSSHILVAAVSFVGGTFLTSLVFYGRIIFLP